MLFHRSKIFYSLLISIVSFTTQAESLEQILQQVKKSNNIAQMEWSEQAEIQQLQLDNLTKLTQQKRQLLADVNRKNRELEQTILTLQQELSINQKLIAKNRKSVEEIVNITTSQHSNFVTNASKFAGWKLAGSHKQLNPDNLDVEDIRTFWHELVEQFVTGAKITTSRQAVMTADGFLHQDDVYSIGPFSHYSEALGWLVFSPEYQYWQTISPQPDLKQSSEYWLIDPTFGSALQTYSGQPVWWDSYRPAGVVGIIIALVALAGFILGSYRIVQLFSEQLKIKRQLMRLNQLSSKNMLGRVFLKAEQSQRSEQLEDVIDACISKEMPWLNRGIGTVAVLAAIAPLLGLLGTVGGMIETFALLKIQGATSSELLSGGISEALLTTKLGLITAIPLLLLHCLMKSKARELAEVIEHQVAALVVDKKYQSGQLC